MGPNLSPIVFKRAIVFATFGAMLILSDLDAAEVPLRIEPKKIVIGVRSDAEPFSYKASRNEDEPVLKGYGGYMIEICRRVLVDMVADGPFAGYDTEFRKLDVKERWLALKTGKVDLLCGPDSITLGRLVNYNASHPLFLSGITFVRTMELPVKTHCEGVIGLLKATTAESEGLDMLVRSHELGRFEAPIRAFLHASKLPPAADDGIEVGLAKLSRDLGAYDNAPETVAPTQTVPSSIITGECSESGYTSGPVIFYGSHDEGINAFCRGNVLYYLGDFDIIKRKLGNQNGCNFLTRRETLTREAYGVFFRRTRDLSANALRDGALYAEFNNVLLRKMEAEDILRYEFSREFSNVEPSSDLEAFFDSFRYARH